MVNCLSWVSYFLGQSFVVVRAVSDKGSELLLKIAPHYEGLLWMGTCTPGDSLSICFYIVNLRDIR